MVEAVVFGDLVGCGGHRLWGQSCRDDVIGMRAWTIAARRLWAGLQRHVQSAVQQSPETQRLSGLRVIAMISA